MTDFSQSNTPNRLATIRERLAADELGAEQLGGFTCAYCGGRDGEMFPLTRIDGPQLFMHVDCDLYEDPMPDGSMVLDDGSEAR